MRRSRARHLQPVPRRRVGVFAASSVALFAFVLLVPHQSSSTSQAAEPASPPAVEQSATPADLEQEAPASTVGTDAVVSAVTGVDVDQQPEEQSVLSDGAVMAQKSTGRLVVPQVGIDAPALTYALTDGIGDPPTHQDAYVVEGYGKPSDPTSGTAYVLVHSGYQGEALGDLLTDTEAKDSYLEPDDLFYVDGVEFEVVSEARHSKDSLERVDASGIPLVPEVWEDVEGRLVLMTCLQRAQGSSVEVVVVTAQAVV